MYTVFKVLKYVNIYYTILVLSLFLFLHIIVHYYGCHLYAFGFFSCGDYACFGELYFVSLLLWFASSCSITVPWILGLPSSYCMAIVDSIGVSCLGLDLLLYFTLSADIALVPATLLTSATNIIAKIAASAAAWVATLMIILHQTFLNFHFISVLFFHKT